MFHANAGSSGIPCVLSPATTVVTYLGHIGTQQLPVYIPQRQWVTGVQWLSWAPWQWSGSITLTFSPISWWEWLAMPAARTCLLFMGTWDAVFFTALSSAVETHLFSIHIFFASDIHFPTWAANIFFVRFSSIHLISNFWKPKDLISSISSVFGPSKCGNPRHFISQDFFNVFIHLPVSEGPAPKTCQVTRPPQIFIFQFWKPQRFARYWFSSAFNVFTLALWNPRDLTVKIVQPEGQETWICFCLKTIHRPKFYRPKKKSHVFSIS